MKFPRWFWLLASLALFLAEVPYLFAWAIQPEGTLYLGVHSNYDDHAVYASWMKQAQEGHFFFENRFTTDAQPGISVNLYFWVAGTVSRLIGIPLAMHLAKVVFGLLFLMALFRLARRLSEDEFVQQVAFSVAVFGAGVGWLFWTRYGFDAPIDVWQPEAFTFPSLMTNGLFCVALWLICVIWNKILDCQESWKPVVTGALAVLLLTNIHTYDTLTIAIVSAGFLASQVAARTFSWAWLARAGCIAAGAAPAVLWFVHVRSVDPVFRERGETGTFSPYFAQILVGYGPLLVLALGAFLYLRKGNWAPLLGAAALLVLAKWQSVAGYAANSLWLDVGPWLAVFSAGVAICALYRPKTPTVGLMFAWALLGIWALYYPGLFQRKLAMGLSIPIGLMAGFALAQMLVSAATRKVMAAALVLLASLVSTRWIQRECQMAVDNISNTTMQKVFWDKDTAAILSYLRAHKASRDAIIARPGQAVPIGDDPQDPTAYVIGLPDINPIMTGWAGIKSYAGHWSETPHMGERRKEVIGELFDDRMTTRESAAALISLAKATYLIIPKGRIAELMHVPPLAFYRAFGTVVYDGDDLALIQVSARHG